MMRISLIDESAARGTTPLHEASPKAKVASFVMVLTAVVTVQNALVILAVALLLAALALRWRMPAAPMLALAAYPGVFAAVFAFASAPDPLTAAAVVLKAVTAASAAVLLVFSTPYPQVFAPLQRLSPPLVGDAMLMTYRSLFLLARRFAGLVTAIRLRSGISAGHPLRAARATARALGPLLLYSFDLAQRDYDVMRLRGYERRLRAYMPPGESPALDAAVLLAGAAVLAAAVAFRVWWRALNPYSWIPPLAGLLLVGWSLVGRRKEPRWI